MDVPVISRLWHHFVWWLLWRHIKNLACLHACKFKEAGSSFHYVHVHVLHKGDGKKDNPRRWTGLGHDDRTNGNDPHHNTVSGPTGCDFMTPAQVPKPINGWPPFHGAPKPNEGIKAGHLEARYAYDIYLALPDSEGRCPRGFTRIRCDCGEFCLTLSRAAWDEWYATLDDD